MAAKADYANCKNCCMPVHIPQKQQPTPCLDKIYNQMQKLPFFGVNTLSVTIKKAHFGATDHEVTITRTGPKTWTLFIDLSNKTEKCARVITNTASFEEFYNGMSDDAQISISDPLCVSHYIKEEWICAINVRIM